MFIQRSCWGCFLAVAGLYLLLNASFVAAAQVLVYVGAVNVLILFAIMLVNKREDLAPIPGLTTRRLLSGGVCAGLFALLTRVVVTTPWAQGPEPIGEGATIRIGEHLFTDYLLPFELASVLLLMAMIGAIVYVDVQSVDPGTGEMVDQGLIEKDARHSWSTNPFLILHSLPSVMLAELLSGSVPLEAYLVAAVLALHRCSGFDQQPGTRRAGVDEH